MKFITEILTKIRNKKYIKIMETIDLKEVRKQFSEKDIKSNLALCQFEIKNLINKNSWRLNCDIVWALNIDLNNSTLSYRKRIAKRIYVFLKKKSRNSIYLLIKTIQKNSLYYVNESLLEEEVNSLRKRYKEFKKLTEDTRLQLKDKKKELSILKKD